jgi:hypothetical protein
MLVYSHQQRTVGKEFSKHVLQAGFNNFIETFVLFSRISVVKCYDYSRTALRTKLKKKQYFQLIQFLHAISF